MSYVIWHSVCLSVSTKQQRERSTTEEVCVLKMSQRPDVVQTDVDMRAHICVDSTLIHTCLSVHTVQVVIDLKMYDNGLQTIVNMRKFRSPRPSQPYRCRNNKLGSSTQ